MKLESLMQLFSSVAQFMPRMTYRRFRWGLPHQGPRECARRVRHIQEGRYRDVYVLKGRTPVRVEHKYSSPAWRKSS